MQFEAVFHGYVVALCSGGHFIKNTQRALTEPRHSRFDRRHPIVVIISAKRRIVLMCSAQAASCLRYLKERLTTVVYYLTLMNDCRRTAKLQCSYMFHSIYGMSKR